MANPKGAWREPKIPYNDDAARWVLGTILADPPMYQHLAAFLRASDFYPTHRAIWEALDAIVAAGGTPDELAVITYLERHGRLAEAGGLETITPLSTGVPPNYPYTAVGWAKILLQDAECRANYDLGNAHVQASQRPLDAAPRAEIVRQQARLDDIQRRIRGEGSAGTGASAYEPLGVRMSDVAVEDFQWLWHRRVALGKMTLFDGDGGVGKSLVSIDLAARVAMGCPMPDNTPGLGAPAGAILICGEDGLADTVKPRLLAAGASPEALARVRAINLVPEPLADGTISQRLLSLVADLAALETTITATGARLLIVDPISAYLGGTIDTYKDSEVRRSLTPLALLSERVGVATVLVRHLNRANGAPAQHRGLGSVAFLNVARIGLLFVPNPDTEGEVLVSRYKGNVGASPPTLAYRIVQVGAAENMPRLSWLGEREMTAEAALAAQTGAAVATETRSATDEAVEWLRSYLADGPRPAKEIQDAAKADKITERPLRKAKERLAIVAYREGGIAGGGRWMWHYDAPSPADGHLRQNDTAQQAPKPESNGAAPKMTADGERGHLSTEEPPKMTVDGERGHLSMVPAFNGADASSQTLIMPKVTSTGEEDKIAAHGQVVCPLCGGADLRDYGDGPGLLRCWRCDELIDVDLAAREVQGAERTDAHR